MPKKAKVKPFIEDLTAVIRRDGKKPIKIDAWRYYSIMDALRWMDVDRQKAADAAKKCGRTHEEISFTVTKEITIELKKERKKNARKEEALPGSSGEVPD